MKKHEILLALSDHERHDPMAVILALQEKGYEVTAAGKSEPAVNMLHEKDFDLVITDFLIVLEKAKETNPKIMALLILTVSCTSIPTFDAIRSAPDDYLFKPFELNELLMRTANCIEKMESKRTNAQIESQAGTLDEKTLNMAKILSHDIRGSLVSISATLELLNRGRYGKMDESVANRLRELLSKTHGLIDMTEEYLERAFAADEGLAAKGEALNLTQDIIYPTLRELAPELRQHRVLIDKRFDAISIRRVLLKVNRTWLKTVFRNLLKNAIKYGEQGCTIILGFEDQGSRYQLNVYNSGKPIPEEYRDRLFSKWGQAGNAGKRSTEGLGLGLGLYLIKNIIQRQGGNIWYETRGEGSNFVFTLPSASTFSANSLLPIGPAQSRLAVVDTLEGRYPCIL
jgi:signal transduction histidine kinase